MKIIDTEVRESLIIVTDQSNCGHKNIRSDGNSIVHTGEEIMVVSDFHCLDCGYQFTFDGRLYNHNGTYLTLSDLTKALQKENKDESKK